MTKKTVTVMRILVALNLPTSMGSFIIKAKAIYKAMLNNPYFTTSTARLAILNTNILALDAAITACQTIPPTGSVEARNAAVELVKTDLRFLKSDVQTAADNNHAKAAVIITSAAMDVKEINPHGKRQNTAQDDTEEGSVTLTGEGAGPHEWRMSLDEKVWTALPASRTSKSKIKNLTSGTVYFFQNRRMLTNDKKK